METEPADPVTVSGIELLVSGINVALDFFHGVLGFPVVWHGQAADAVGEAVVLDAGTIALTLFEPRVDTAALDSVVPDRSARLSQIVVGGSGDSIRDAVDRVLNGGISIQEMTDGRSFVPPAVFEGVVGFPTTLMLTPLDDPR